MSVITPPEPTAGAWDCTTRPKPSTTSIVVFVPPGIGLFVVTVDACVCDTP
ncbi:hypothetical protein [Leifsonia xyli]|uniref:hypothetical protein n=1 Tax=Leifsonia xyli TaxID=1575 RepID=UPI00031C972D|nr:hypothetical protein [Leifsonia xyli]